MAEKLDPKDLLTIEELAISNMWETAALVKPLERKGIITEQEIYDTIRELRRSTPQGKSNAEPFPEPYLSTEKESILIDHIMKTFNATGLTSHQAKTLLGRLIRLVDLGQSLATKTNH